MRPTIDILIDIEDGKKPNYEEVYMACLVQKTLMFFARKNLKSLLKGGMLAELTAKMKFPDNYAELGISKDEYNALRMDPYEFLSPEHIPGTPEWIKMHKVYNSVLEKFLSMEQKKEVET